MEEINNNHNDEVIPINFHLSQNYPNPFKDKTTIKYCVAYKTRVRITIFNSNGELIEKLLDEDKEAGTYEIEFSVKCKSAYDEKLSNQSIEKNGLPDGVYFYEIKTEDYWCKKEMIIQS